MKIAYLSSSVIPSRLANSVHVMKMCQALAVNADAVVLLAPNASMGREELTSDIFSYYGVRPIFSIQWVFWSRWLGRSYLSGFLAAIRIAFGGYDLAVARCLPSAFFAALFKIPVIFEYHQPINDSGRMSRLNVFLFKRLIRRKSFVSFIAITHALKSDFLDHYPELVGRVFVAPDGSDAFPEQFEKITLARSSHRLQVGYVGQLYSGKGMEVVSALCKAAPFVDFHVVGGLQSDIKKWQAEILAENITFHGYVPHSQTPGYIAAFDVLLLPNQKKITWHKAGGDIGRWTSPLKMFEYMSAGKPIISSDIPVLREVLQDDVNALLCPPEDIAAWVHALKRLENPQLRARLGGRALADFLSSYTWAHRARLIIEHFKSFNKESG
ncbi:glycosyltransferase family 4 protein [Ectopseudomonas mendocina]|uniref:glycosyltransferase family 4 protein n=1 Tax=Ectopseudomonas mendocina TaxID=300 RepID=UPI00376F1ADB